jgi:hypothetical protein
MLLELERKNAEERMKSGVNQYTEPSVTVTEGKGQTRDKWATPGVSGNR